VNIAYFAYRVDGVLETPTSLLFNHLNRKHRVWMFDGHHVPLPEPQRSWFWEERETDYDMDWSVSVHENLYDIKFAFRLAKKRYVHLEWMVPWRIGHSGYGRNWEYECPPKHERDYYLALYKNFGEYYVAADVKSLASIHFRDYMSELFRTDLSDVPIKCPSVDNELCTYSLVHAPQKERSITTVSRLIPHKRILDVAKALAKWNKKVTWNLIGQGPELEEIQSIIARSDVRLEYRGWINGTAKMNYMKNSLCIHPWNGIQPGESLLMGSFNISMDDLVMREYYQDSIDYYSSIDDLVDKIDYYWDRPDECKDRAIKGANKIMKNELPINTAQQEADFVLDLIENA
jgi:glycosyltransferase involved in cell wall biosynthesis